MITFELPYPPSVNHYWRFFSRRVVVSRAGRAFKEKVRAILMAARVPRLCGPLIVTVDLYPPDRRRRDVDNAQKSLLDSMQYGGLYEDDSQIVKLVLEKHGPVPNGKAVVRVEERRQ